MNRILIVDDEPSVSTSIKELLEEQGYQVETADRAESALERVQAEPPKLMICDIQLPGMNGLDLFRRIHASRPKLPVIIMTAYGTTETAIEATKLGAFDYLLKPFDPGQMLQLVERAIDTVRLMNGAVSVDPGTPPTSGDAIIGQSAAMQEVYKAIGRVAPTDASVLIRGETGTGKELVARAIYQHSRRHDKPLLMVNCVAIPDTLLESELFGHERGAFTGAAARRIGKFEQANGGTIFLDEVGDLPLTTQAKLLRVLQERTFERIGGNETIRVDVRLIAATNRELESAIGAGLFRDDLYHRLNVVTIRIPALRERREDIPRLAEYFLDRFSRQLAVEKPQLASDVLDTLARHDWPGNVRELEHCIHRAMIFTRGYPIRGADILRALERPSAESALPRPSAPVGQSFHVGMTLRDVERELIQMTLASTSGNKREAARILGISRRALYDKLKKFGLM